MSTKTLTDDDGDTLRIEQWRSGRVSLVTYRSGTCTEVGPFNPAVLIAAIREVAGETDDKPEPAPALSTPTAEDFARAEFARHEDGLIAARADYDRMAWWVHSPTKHTWYSDADMAAEGWSIVTPAPSTPREALALAVSLAYEPEGDTMPAGAGCMIVRDNGKITALPDGYPVAVDATFDGGRRLLLDPPAPVTPAWHNARIVEAVCRGRVCQWASTSDGMWVSLDGDNFATHRDYLRDVTVVVPEEVEA